MNGAKLRPARFVVVLSICAGVAAGCRLGGAASTSPSSDEDSEVEVHAVDAAADSGGAGGEDAGSAGRGAAEPVPTAGAAGTPTGPRAGSRSVADTPVPAQPRPDAGSADSVEDSGVPGEPDAIGCGTTETIEVCNPITNDGCLAELGMQCDVDLFAATLSGACVFSAPAPIPDVCLSIPPTQTCPPRHTCVEGACSRVCLCDADCGPGACCTDALGDRGFKTCSTC